jgi:hypothetical protein
MTIPLDSIPRFTAAQALAAAWELLGVLERHSPDAALAAIRDACA